MYWIGGCILGIAFSMPAWYWIAGLLIGVLLDLD